MESLGLVQGPVAGCWE